MMSISLLTDLLINFFGNVFYRNAGHNNLVSLWFIYETKKRDEILQEKEGIYACLKRVLYSLIYPVQVPLIMTVSSYSGSLISIFLSRKTRRYLVACFK